MRSASRNTVQVVPELVSQFAQVTELDGLMGVPVSVTVVPVVNCAAQVVPQLMPAGALATVPVPPPMVTARLLNAPPCGQPLLMGPSTVIVEELLATKLGLS